MPASRVFPSDPSIPVDGEPGYRSDPKDVYSRDMTRRSAILALLLVIVINTVAAACVSDLSGMRASHCVRKAEQTATKILKGDGCGGSVHRLPDTCRVRGFSQSPVAAIARVEPLQVRLARAAKVAAPDGPHFVVTSVGPPETDRGPPRS